MVLTNQNPHESYYNVQTAMEITLLTQDSAEHRKEIMKIKYKTSILQKNEKL